MSSVDIAHLIVLVLAIVFATLVYALTSRGLVELLRRTVTVPGGVIFFSRAFLLIILFGALGAALSSHLDVKDGEHFMEYVWVVASGLGDTLSYTFMALAVYLVLMTILVAALKPKDDQ